MKTFILSISFLIGAAIGFAGDKADFNQLVLDSCNDLDNCIVEGKIGYLQEKAVNEIVYKMCKIQLSPFDRIACYYIAYERIPHLPNNDLTRSYEGQYSVQVIKSYYHYVRRTCSNIFCRSDARSCDDSTVKCWQELSVNLRRNVESILGTRSPAGRGEASG